MRAGGCTDLVKRQRAVMTCSTSICSSMGYKATVGSNSIGEIVIALYRVGKGKSGPLRAWEPESPV